jgi:DNA-binding HxlR family transcriptional regulator/putative sterol carrier protein
MRSYRQYCPAAHALDVVGERWALLIVRELLSGPRRYTDLKDALPGIGPNVLAERLRTLEAAGVLRRRRLPSPAAVNVYELTELGEDLRPVVAALFRWGLRLLGAPSGGETVKASYWLPALEALADEHPPPADVEEVYELRVGEESITVAARRGRVEIREGEAVDPHVVARTDTRTFLQLGLGRISPLDALASGTLTVEGDEDAARRLGEIFATGQAQPVAGEAPV